MVRSSTLWHHIEKYLEQCFSLESNTIQCKEKGLLCPYEYAAVLCYTYIVYLFCCHGCQHISQTQISVLFIMQFLTSFAISVTLGPGILHSQCSPTPSICVFPLGEGITVSTHVRQWAKTPYCVLFNWCVFRYLAHTLLSYLGFMPR